jgi:excinuclease UvrABC nuclease subunit
MNPRLFFTLAAAWLLAVPTLFAAQAPKLDQLLAEYHKARADVLTKLNANYAQQADAMAKQYKQAKDTVRFKRAADFAARLLDSDESNDLQGIKAGDPGPEPLAILQADYAHARDENLRVVDTFYISNAQNLEAQLLKENNPTGAKVLATFLEKIKGSNAATPRAKTHH